MGSILGKGGTGATTGFRYYFAVLAGICRGPVDEIFLIKAADKFIFDPHNYTAGDPQSFDPNPVDPEPPFDADQSLGPITDNRVIPISRAACFGGDEREGGISGFLWTYMGDKDQLIPPGDWIRTVMSGLLLSGMRGVVTTFFDGEVTANTPYPKAWNYRIRRTVSGWDGDPWYPEKCAILMTDTSVPTFVASETDSSTDTFTTYVTGPTDTDITGASTGNATVYSVVTSQNGDIQTTTTYQTATGSSTSTYVPTTYNAIRAMNPAHIVYECCTNRDWGRGMDRALLDHASFAAAADTLYDEGAGLCLKWSRSEDINRFVQTIIDHCGAVLYTDRITGLLCMRLIRADYDVAELSIFDYDTGLLEVTSIQTAADDANPNEIIVKYNSPVLDQDQQVRQQNIASITAQGCVYSTTKEYPGIPTADLALRVAARDLRVASHAWKVVTFTVDRRGYRITPGDCLIVNVPEKGLNMTVLRVATVEDSVLTDGKLTVVGSRDVYSLPGVGVSEQQANEFLPQSTAPQPVTKYQVFEGTYWDLYRALNGTPQFEDYANDPYLGIQGMMAEKPAGSSLNFKWWAARYHQFGGARDPQKFIGVGTYGTFGSIAGPLTTAQTSVQVAGFDPRRVNLPQVMSLLGQDSKGSQVQEFVNVTAMVRDASNGRVTATILRGCIDTPARPWPAGSKLFDYQESVNLDSNEYTFNDEADSRLIDHTSSGDFANNDPYNENVRGPLLGFGARIGSPYPPANAAFNGKRRDEVTTITGDIVVTFARRNRLVQQDKVLSDVDGDVTPESGDRYNLQVAGPFANSDFTVGGDSSPVTVTSDELVARGYKAGDTIRIELRNQNTSHPLFAQVARYGVDTTFVWYPSGSTPPVTPPTGSGFDNNFDNNFDHATGFDRNFDRSFNGG